MNDQATITYRKTNIEGVWQIHIGSAESAMFDHWGYVYADEVGMFSMSIYSTKESALEHLHLYNEGLNNYDAKGDSF